MRVLLIDAYDSFVHIIDQYLRTLGARTEVVRSLTRTPGELAGYEPDAVVLGPGPGHPAESGHVALVHEFAGRVPLLGSAWATRRSAWRTGAGSRSPTG